MSAVISISVLRLNTGQVRFRHALASVHPANAGRCCHHAALVRVRRMLLAELGGRTRLWLGLSDAAVRRQTSKAARAPGISHDRGPARPVLLQHPVPPLPVDALICYHSAIALAWRLRRADAVVGNFPSRLGLTLPGGPGIAAQHLAEDSWTPCQAMEAAPAWLKL